MLVLAFGPFAFVEIVTLGFSWAWAVWDGECCTSLSQLLLRGSGGAGSCGLTFPPFPPPSSWGFLLHLDFHAGLHSCLSLLEFCGPEGSPLWTHQPSHKHGAELLPENHSTLSVSLILGYFIWVVWEWWEWQIITHFPWLWLILRVQVFPCCCSLEVCSNLP